MRHLGYKSLIMLKNLSSGMDFKAITPSELYENCWKRDQTCQLSRSPISKSSEFLGWIHSDLEESFPRIRQSYWYYIFFLEESIDLINVEPLKFKDDVLAAFKNYKALQKKQSSCQLKVLYTDRGGKYMEEFNN